MLKHITIDTAFQKIICYRYSLVYNQYNCISSTKVIQLPAYISNQILPSDKMKDFYN